MNQPDNHEDLERLLREAFAAKAEQVDQQDLDLAREDEVADQLRTGSGAGRARRLVAGVGILAAAAAAVGVVALAIHPGKQHTTDAVHPAVTATSTAASTTRTVGVGPSTATTPSSSVTTEESAEGAQVPPPSSGVDRLSTLPSTPPTSSTTTPPQSSTTVTSNGSSGTSMTVESATALPPAMPSGLPQSGQLTVGQEYDGPVPLAAIDDSGTRMLSMADGTKWEVTAQGNGSMTVRLTDLPVDIEAYWAGALPSQGWQQSGGGWTFPGTPYAVSAITDTGSFTVSW